MEAGLLWNVQTQRSCQRYTKEDEVTASRAIIASAACLLDTGNITAHNVPRFLKLF